MAACYFASDCCVGWTIGFGVGVGVARVARAGALDECDGDVGSAERLGRGLGRGYVEPVSGLGGVAVGVKATAAAAVVVVVVVVVAVDDDDDVQRERGNRSWMEEERGCLWMPLPRRRTWTSKRMEALLVFEDLVLV